MWLSEKMKKYLFSIGFKKTDFLLLGDRIFQYTDGVTEATDKDDQLYGMERLDKVLNRSCADCNPEQTLKLVKADIDAFVGEADQFDDITMLSLAYVRKMII